MATSVQITLIICITLVLMTIGTSKKDKKEDDKDE